MDMLQNEISKYEKKLSNSTKTVSIKDKEIYQLNVEIENIKSLLEKEAISLNVSQIVSVNYVLFNLNKFILLIGKNYK